MKWYETPIEDLYDSARLALARNDEDAYRENLFHAVTLIGQREFQTVGIPNGAPRITIKVWTPCCTWSSQSCV